jgi:hypothetical protein
MPRKVFTQLLTGALVVCFWVICAPISLAHGGPPRIELGVERIAPGAALEIRGINIAPELPISVALVGAGAEFGLGTVTGDAHGDFTQAFTVPEEAIAGGYTVRAFGANRVIVTAALTIAGAAVDEEGEGEQRDQGEPLLAPMPQAGAEPEVQPARPVAPRTQPADVPPVIAIPRWLAVALVMSIVAIGLAVALRRRAAGASEVVHWARSCIRRHAGD